MRAEKEYEELYTKAKARMHTTTGAITDADVIVGLQREVDYYRGRINRLEKNCAKCGAKQETISAASPKWISVKNRLPGPGSYVLVYTKDYCDYLDAVTGTAGE